MPTTTLNAANLQAEFASRTTALGRQPKRLEVKDGTLEATARGVVATGVIGGVDIIVNAALNTNEWVLNGRPDVPGPNSAEARLARARSADTRRRSFAAPGAGAVAPYGGGDG